MPISRLWILGFVFLLAGCDIPKATQVMEKDGATFEIKSFEGKSISVNMHSDIAVPVSNNYNFSACITNLRLKSKPIVGHRFLIEEINKVVSTDVEGCINWSETVEFNFLAQSKYLAFERTIVAVGIHRGKRVIKYAMDPWSHGDEKPKDVVDLSKDSSLPDDWIIKDKDSVMAAMLGHTMDQSPHARSIWIETGRINSQEDRLTNKGFEITYEVHGNPQIILTRVNGNKVLYDIVSGNFAAEMQLIHVVQKDGKIQRKVLAEKSFDSVKVSNKNLALKARFNYIAPYWGHLYIGIKLAAKKAPPGLKPFEGLYYIGDYGSIKANGWLKISSLVQNNRDFTIEKFISGSYEDVTALNEDSAAADLGTRGDDQDFAGRNRVFVKPLEFDYIKSEDDNGHRRRVSYQVRVCMSNPIDSRPIQGQKFNITKFRQSESEPAQHPEGNPLMSQIDSGCVYWNEEIPVEMYDCQKYIKGFVDIENSDLGMKQRVHYFINPWLSTPMLGVDEIKVKNSLGKECEGSQEIDKPRYIFVFDFGYSLQSMGYNIDSNFNLTVHRYANIDIDTKVINYSDLQHGRSGSMPLRDGLFLVKIVMAKNPAYNEKSEYVTHAFQLVESRGGRLSLRNVNFPFRNPLDIANRNSVFVQVLPADKSKVERYKTSFGNIAYRPLPNLKFEDVVDHNVPLTPLIYEGKILLLGTERGSFAVQDSHGDMILNLERKDGKGLEAYQKLSEERLKALDQIVADGTKDIQNESLFTMADYAKGLDLKFINLDSDSEDITFLQRLSGLAMEPLLKPYYRVFPGEDKLKRTQKRFIEQINSPQLKPRSTEWILSSLKADSLNPDLARRLCAYWVNQFISPAFNEDSLDDLTRKCVQGNDDYVSGLFLKEKLYFVRKIGNFSYDSGLWERMGISSSFSMSQTHTRSRTEAMSWAAKAGASFKLPEFLGISLSTGTDVQYALSKAQQDSNSQNNGISVSNSIDLEKQRNTYNIELLDYDECYKIKMNTALFQKLYREELSPFKRYADLLKENFYNHLNLSLPGEKLINTLSRGFLICSKGQTVPLKKQENFYIIQERVDNREYQDAGDKKNRRLFMALRGDSDFQRFEHFTKKGVSTPEGFYFNQMTSEEVNARLLEVFHLQPSAPRIFIDSPLKN